ncbi:cytochrome c oxidase assembly protein COX18, mitochondrial [Austrofundulus limnaeus]|uniref:Cytochrome c oxidase assembly protein COX18, mitochondrial n=1 Tax=Austrofundulus limnaeus TaxID=52670 RepID=A0A2I4D6D5_AUSLI|nr:PREDICTED: mitochondrial inner membrane protein COX18 [Austrofundulus limnaeus]
MLSVGCLVRSRVLLRLRGPAAAAGGLVRWTGPAPVSAPEVPVRSVSGVGGASGAGGWYGSVLDSAPVHLCEHFLVGVQQVSGLPWWQSIVMATILARPFITLPLAAYQLLILSKVQALQKEISEVAKKLHYEVTVRARERGWTEKQCRVHFKKTLRHLVSQLYIRDNCHPFKATLLIWVQLPLWVSLSLALRKMSLDCSALHGELAAGGALWFPDLTVPDSTWVLPVCLGLTNLVNVEMFSLRRSPASSFQRLVLYVFRGFSVLLVPIAATIPSSMALYWFRGFSVLLVPIAATIPSSMALYWFCSSLVGFGQNLLLRSPKFHRILRLPTRRSDSPN